MVLPTADAIPIDFMDDIQITFPLRINIGERYPQDWNQFPYQIQGGMASDILPSAYLILHTYTKEEDVLPDMSLQATLRGKFSTPSRLEFSSDLLD